MASEGKLGHIQEGGGRNFAQDPAGETTRVSHEGDPTNLGYLIFYPGGLSAIKWRPTEGPYLEPSRSTRVDTGSYPRKNQTGS